MKATLPSLTSSWMRWFGRVGLVLLLAGLVLALPACSRTIDGSTPPPADGTQPPGDTDPGDTDPGDSEPGDTDPGDTDPGDTDPGDTDPGDGDWEPTSPPRAVEVASGLLQPLGVVSAGDGRLFVVEQRGTVRVVEDGVVLAEPFLDIRDRVRTEERSEMGLLGLAFPPTYSGAGGAFYVYYTGDEGKGVLSRFRTSTADPNRANADSEEVLKALNTSGTFHKGGQISFGPDGYLYWALGDNKHDESPQDLSWLSGKILRLSVSDSGAYSVPSSNPYVGVDDVDALVWAYGLRNPWRFSFDRATGDMYIADVGEDDFEEVNRWRPGDPTGLNYGWPCLEGTIPYKNRPVGCGTEGFTPPIFVYEHEDGLNGRGSITGGYVYRGPDAPDLVGKYVFADFLTGHVYEASATDDWALHSVLALPGNDRIATLGAGPNGELYVAGYASGKLYEITQRDP